MASAVALFLGPVSHMTSVRSVSCWGGLPSFSGVTKPYWLLTSSGQLIYCLDEYRLPSPCGPVQWNSKKKSVFVYLHRIKNCLFFFFSNVPYTHSVNVHVYIHKFPSGFLCRLFKQSCLHACFCSYWLSQIDGLVNGLAGGTAIHSFCPKTKLDELRICLNSQKNAATRACASRMGWVWVFWLLLDWISSPAAASTLFFLREATGH